MVYNIVIVNVFVVNRCEKRLIKNDAYRPYEFMNSHKNDTEPKEQKKPEVLTEEIKHRIKLIAKAFR
jgi:hypothetical protein